MATLIISEKNKAAQAIAEALGPVNKISESKFVKVYQIKSKNIYVVPLRGHIMQYQNVGPYKKWTTRDPRDIITDSKAIDKIPSNYAGNYIKVLKKYGKMCSDVIIGTDADVEGVNIGIMDALPFVRRVNPKITIKQLWLNDLQQKSIQKAYQNLIAPKWSWAHSGEARSILDVIIGFSATREVSLTLKPILNNIGVQFTSIGRVQTSLLYLLYLREHLIRNFKSSPFWSITADIKIKERTIIAKHLKNNFTNKKIAQAIYNKIKDEKAAEIQKIDTKDKKKYPPAPLNTSKALLLITKNLKINAKTALKALEDLYLNKIISYPRTDSDTYSKDYDHLQILQKLLTNTHYGNYTKSLYKRKKMKPRKGKVNSGDHSPITPLISLEPNSSKFQNNLQKKVYNLIVRSYLATFGDPAIESDTKILLKIKDEPFVTQISVLKSEGFYKIAPFLSKRYDAPLTSLPELTKNLSVENLNKPVLPVKKINCKEKETQPPPRYTDTSLLKLMERKSLGTKSTRPAIIQILIDRNYIERKKRAIFVKELGFLLIDALIVVWKPFLDPKFTAYVENLLVFIKNQKKTMDEVVKEVKMKFLELFDKFRQQKPAFLIKMKTLQKTGNVIRGRNNKVIKGKSSTSGYNSNSNSKFQPVLTAVNCPKCKKSPMKLIISKRKNTRFFVCSDPNCKTFLSLPKKGSIKMLKSQCSICNFNIVKITKSSRGKRFTYYICPLCWNRGFKNGTGGGFCSKCKNFKISRGRCVKK